jgi:hypothetical protein
MCATRYTYNRVSRGGSPKVAAANDKIPAMVSASCHGGQETEAVNG